MRKLVFRIQCLWALFWLTVIYPLSLVLIPLKLLWDEVPEQYVEATQGWITLTRRAWVRFLDGHADRDWQTGKVERAEGGR